MSSNLTVTVGSGLQPVGLSLAIANGVTEMEALGRCPGGEGAVLKTVGPRGLAGSNPVSSV